MKNIIQEIHVVRIIVLFISIYLILMRIAIDKIEKKMNLLAENARLQAELSKIILETHEKNERGEVMKSEWKVTRNIINNKSMYAVYRIKDTAAVDHSGNREFATDYMDDKQEALNIAERLNGEEVNQCK